MGKLIITERENRVGVNIVGGPSESFDKGSLTASNGATQSTVNLYDDVAEVFIARNHPISEFVDSSGTAFSATQSGTVTALNNIVNASPETFIKTTDNITSINGVSSADFTGKTGYTMIVGQSDGSVSTSGSLLFTATDIKLGDDLNVQNHSIYTSATNADVQITPNGTGSVNLDGTVQFKRFDTTDPSDIPAAEEGKMYADTDDNLFFGVSSS